MKLLKEHPRTSGSNAQAVTAVCVVRNEIMRLPGFLTHHRRLGVRDFVFIDNDSTDGTREYLLEQSGVTLLHTEDSYGDLDAGQRKWINDALQDRCQGSWALVLDADELFVYPRCESESIETLTRALDSHGAQGLFAFLLDMYSDRHAASMGPEPVADLVAACPFFDRDYEFSRRPAAAGTGQFPDILVRGGPRERLFREERTGTPWRRGKSVAQGLVHDFYRRFAPERARSLESQVMFQPPELGKMPLVRVSPGLRLSRGGHFSSPLPLYRRNGVLLHFKLMQDYPGRLQRLATAGQHWNASVEQKWLLRRLGKSGDAKLHYPGSVRFEGSEQLERLGLLRDLQSCSGQLLRG